MEKTLPAKIIDFLSSPLRWPARYKIYVLACALFAALLAVSVSQLNAPGAIGIFFSHAALFSLNAFALLSLCGFAYVLCFTPIVKSIKSPTQAALYFGWAAISYSIGPLLIGLMFHISLTALSPNLPKSEPFIFASLSMATVLIFLMRFFQLLEWKRAQDMVFGITIYSMVAGTLFAEVSNLDLSVIPAAFDVYLRTFPVVLPHVLLIALVFEIGTRVLYSRWTRIENGKK